jgi:hypothetical protein
MACWLQQASANCLEPSCCAALVQADADESTDGRYETKRNGPHCLWTYIALIPPVEMSNTVDLTVNEGWGRKQDDVMSLIAMHCSHLHDRHH